MRELRFPVFGTPDIRPKRLSMDEYLRFVQLAYRSLANKKQIREMRLRQVPTARFSLS